MRYIRENLPDSVEFYNNQRLALKDKKEEHQAGSESSSEDELLAGEANIVMHKNQTEQVKPG